MVQLYSPDGGNVSSHNCTWWIRLNLYTIRPTEVHDQNGKSVGLTVSAQLMAESAYTLQWAPLSTRIATFYGGSGPPSNTWCLGSMRAHNPNGTSISSAVITQMTADCPYTLQWFARIPFNIAPPFGASEPHVTHDSLGPPESWTQTATRSLQPFLQGSLCHTDRPTNRPRYSVGNNSLIGRMYVRSNNA